MKTWKMLQMMLTIELQVLCFPNFFFLLNYVVACLLEFMCFVVNYAVYQSILMIICTAGRYAAACINLQ